MSALANILQLKEVQVSGSDTTKSELTTELEKNNIHINYQQRTQNILLEKIDAVVFSNAIAKDHPELATANKEGIPTFSLSQAIGELSKEFQTIAVCGTHGKSTTTAMCSLSLIANQIDPTISIGTKLSELENRNFRVGKGPHFLVEACEYKEAFLHISPNIIIITNIEPDHLDYFKTPENYLKTFRDFIATVPADGLIIANHKDSNITKLLADCQKPVLFYNTPEDQQKYSDLKLQVPGKHNIENALAAVKLSDHLHLNPDKTIKALNNFRGSWRRYQIKGKIGKTTVIDDYAHHPTEIKATLGAARQQNPQAKIAVVFQPHQYNRTHELENQFATAFSDADKVIIPNIYAVRDDQEDLKKTSPEQLVRKISQHHPDAEFGDGLDNTITKIKENHHHWDILFIMGAGDIYTITPQIITESV